MEIYDLGHLDILRELCDEVRFCVRCMCSCPRGAWRAGGERGETWSCSCRDSKRLSGSSWGVAGIGRHELPMAELAARLGGNVRVGLEQHLPEKACSRRLVGSCVKKRQRCVSRSVDGSPRLKEARAIFGKTIVMTRRCAASSSVVQRGAWLAFPGALARRKSASVHRRFAREPGFIPLFEVVLVGDNQRIARSLPFWLMIHRERDRFEACVRCCPRRSAEAGLGARLLTCRLCPKRSFAAFWPSICAMRIGRSKDASRRQLGRFWLAMLRR